MHPCMHICITHTHTHTNTHTHTHITYVFMHAYVHKKKKHAWFRSFHNFFQIFFSGYLTRMYAWMFICNVCLLPRAYAKASLYTYKHAHIHTGMFADTYVNWHFQAQTWVYVYTYIHTYTCLWNSQSSVRRCVCVCLYTCMCVCVSVSIYTDLRTKQAQLKPTNAPKEKLQSVSRDECFKSAI